MKKLISIILVISLCFGLVACGGPVQEGENSNLTDDVKTENAQSESEEAAEQKNVVVIDNEHCYVEITEAGISKKAAEIKLLLENRTSENNQMFTIESATVNGIDSDPFWATDVAAGKKANVTVEIALDEFAKDSVDKLSDIHIDFRVYDYDDWMADDYARESVNIYPYGEDKIEKYLRTDEVTDIILVDNEYVKVVAFGVDPDDLFGYEVLLYIENKTETDIMVSSESVSVNGFMCDPFWATEVVSNAVKFTSVQWYDSLLEESEIESVDEVEMTLKAYDYDSWGDYYVEDVVTFTTE
ncbi:MAG: hypothetical protein IKU47_00685, partial [Oscillospiraceae bacterium]|nr:hypothetical protein [Oscillospiraceae bacterium]